MTAHAEWIPVQRYPDPPHRFLQTSSCAWASGLRLLPLGLVFASLLGMPLQSFAQANRPVIAASSPAISKPLPTAPIQPASSGPAWSALTAVQQQTLKPLAESWNTISAAQKRKWLEISRNYPSLPPEGQAVMRSRMSEWVALSPQQRAQARLNFAKTKELSRELTAEEKKERWETYQALSAEEKQKLAAKASPKTPGAATAVKPVAPQKLAVPPPPAGPASRPAAKISLPAATLVQPAPARASENSVEPKR
ncbi:MAG: DUF3106 domain-containing protein [Polaromonas sp.]|nr:DUF3106 domain-containing protein [Polaromonas sp.]